MTKRPCTRVSCHESAAATLTYAYADQMAVLGPLSQQPEPHGYDLCAAHADRLRVPKGWSVLRISAPDEEHEVEPEPERRSARAGRPLRRV